ncbi:hypothetical protein BST61_g5775 [Cercospora zeina]
MVLRPRTQQSPEDSSMTNGIFNEHNTTPPPTTQIHTLFNLTHKTAIVSGAGAGIGYAVAEALAVERAPMSQSGTTATKKP